MVVTRVFICYFFITVNGGVYIGYIYFSNQVQGTIFRFGEVDFGGLLRFFAGKVQKKINYLKFFFALAQILLYAFNNLQYSSMPINFQ